MIGDAIMENKLIGLWRMVSMEQRYDDGRVVYPFGQDAQGYICYTKEGFMFGGTQKAGRVPFQTGGQWTASDEEKARAYDQYLTYCGWYEVLPDGRLNHKIEISLFPNWIGAEQPREFEQEGDELRLKAKIEQGTSEARTSYLIFKKVEKA